MYLYINYKYMNINECKFKFNKSKLEFKNLTENSLIYSIRFGQVNNKIGFINHIDYSVIKFNLTESNNEYTFFYNDEKFSIEKDKLQSNGIIEFSLLD